MDDEDSIRQITKATLETFGYRVVTAAGVQMFLPKPYTAEKLLKALAQLLRGA